jgi:hypothetical protein
LLTCSPNPWLDNDISFWLANWCLLIIQHQFEGGC